MHATHLTAYRALRFFISVAVKMQGIHHFHLYNDYVVIYDPSAEITLLITSYFLWQNPQQHYPY